MIEFKGVLSEKVQWDKIRRNNQNFNIIFSLISCLALFVFVLLSCLFDFYREIIGVIIIYVIIIFIVLLLNNKMPKRNLMRFKIDMHIQIENNQLKTVIWRYGERIWVIKPLSKIKKILDVGECYYIIFKLGDISNAWICQKDLIVQGTIEEFEKLFEDKIVRKYKQD